MSLTKLQTTVTKKKCKNVYTDGIMRRETCKSCKIAIKKFPMYKLKKPLKIILKYPGGAFRSQSYIRDGDPLRKQWKSNSWIVFAKILRLYYLSS